jgi:hypothetical protein
MKRVALVMQTVGAGLKRGIVINYNKLLTYYENKMPEDVSVYIPF